MQRRLRQLKRKPEDTLRIAVSRHRGSWHFSSPFLNSSVLHFAHWQLSVVNALINRGSGKDKAKPGRTGMWRKASRTERGLESYGVNLRLAFRCHSPPHREQGEERWRDAPKPPARTCPCNPRPWLRPRPTTPPATHQQRYYSVPISNLTHCVNISHVALKRISVLSEKGLTFVSKKKSIPRGPFC